VHEFMGLAGEIDAPTWTFDYGFLPEMGEAIGAVTERSGGTLLGRTTYEMFRAGLVDAERPDQLKVLRIAPAGHRDGSVLSGGGVVE
jgi:hypothetical protein